GSTSREDVNRIARISRSGVMQYHYPSNININIGQDFSFEPYYQQITETEEHVFSRALLSPQSGKPVIVSASPVFNGDEFDGLVTINFELSNLSDSLFSINQQRSVNNRVNIIVIDQEGRTMAQSKIGRLLQPVMINNETIFPGPRDSIIATDEEGVEWLYTFAPVPSSGWMVIVQHQTQLAFASLENYQRGLIIAMVLFSGGTLLFWIFLSRRVIGPLERLTEYGESISFRVSEEYPKAPEILSLRTRSDQLGRLTETLLTAEQGVRRRLAELTTLNKTSTAVLSSLDTQKVIDTVLDEVQRLLQVKQCALFAVDTDAKHIEIVASRGLSTAYEEYLDQKGVPLVSLPFIAISTDKPVQVSDIQTKDQTHLQPLAKIGNYRSMLAIPLSGLYREPMALVIFRPDVHYFTQQEVNLAQNFANHAAIALEQAELFRNTDTELQKQVSFLSALNQVGHTVSQSLVIDEILNNTISAVFQVTPSESCWIFLSSEFDPQIRLRAHRGVPDQIISELEKTGNCIENSVVNYVFDSEKPLLLSAENAAQAEIQASDLMISGDDWQWLAAVPLKAKETAIGVLGMISQENQAYTENEIDLLEAIGDQIALAVVNARLYRRSREIATVEERNRVAREIHDTLVQSLTGILIHLQGAQRFESKSPDKAAESINDALALAHESIREARRSVLNLRPHALETLPLGEAIESHLDRTGIEANLKSSFVLKGVPVSLSSDVEQHLYRISQEALTNIKRHANANKVEIELNYQPRQVTLTIVDDGIGIQHEQSNKDQLNQSHQGFGLLGIQERVRLIDGQVSISHPSRIDWGKGTEIKVRIPT
ncbi:MAG: GAF domain-containing protein, partial [Chloroflexota bacterium]